jgi:hypothetical protein
MADVATSGFSPWPHFGRTAALNAAAQCATMSGILAGQQLNEHVAATRGDLYGSDAHGRDVASAAQFPAAHGQAVPRREHPVARNLLEAI